MHDTIWIETLRMNWRERMGRLFPIAMRWWSFDLSMCWNRRRANQVGAWHFPVSLPSKTNRVTFQILNLVRKISIKLDAHLMTCMDSVWVYFNPIDNSRSGIDMSSGRSYLIRIRVEYSFATKPCSIVNSKLHRTPALIRKDNVLGRMGFEH